MIPNPIIQINNLSKKYKGADFFSIKELSLTIREGEIQGLLGPNGAGKTSMISMMCGLLKPTSGQILIDGLNFKKNGRQIRQSIGLVPQEYSLYPTLTAHENLMYFGSMFGLKGDSLKEKIVKNLKELGLDQFKDKKIVTYSGGMKRRVNLIASMLHHPRILFLDEPTVGVDVQSKNVIFEHLKMINQSGTTIVYTSHHINEAQDFCTRLAILDHGRILTQGKPSELIQQTKNANNLEDVFIDLTGKSLRDYA